MEKVVLFSLMLFSSLVFAPYSAVADNNKVLKINPEKVKQRQKICAETLDFFKLFLKKIAFEKIYKEGSYQGEETLEEKQLKEDLEEKKKELEEIFQREKIDECWYWDKDGISIDNSGYEHIGSYKIKPECDINKQVVYKNPLHQLKAAFNIKANWETNRVYEKAQKRMAVFEDALEKYQEAKKETEIKIEEIQKQKKLQWAAQEADRFMKAYVITVKAYPYHPSTYEWSEGMEDSQALCFASLKLDPKSDFYKKLNKKITKEEISQRFDSSHRFYGPYEGGDKGLEGDYSSIFNYLDGIGESGFVSENLWTILEGEESRYFNRLD